MEELIRSISIEDAPDGKRGRRRGVRITFSMLLPDAAFMLFSALLASCSPLDGISPFGAACLLAAWHSGMDPVFACVGAVAGYFISGNYVFGSTCLLMGAGLWLLNSKRKIRRIYRLLLAFGAESLLNLIFALIFGKNALLMTGSATVSVFGAVVIASGIHGMRSLLGGRVLNDTELLTLSAVIGLMTFSMRSFNIFGQSPAVIFSAACALFLAYRLGIPAAAAAITAGAGHILATNADLHFVAALASATLITASLRPLGKWVSLVCFAVISCFCTFLFGGNGTVGYIECGVACLIFALVPSKLYFPASVKSELGAAAKPDPRFSRMQYRIASLAEVLSELARVYGSEDGRLLSCISGTLRRTLNVGAGRPEEQFEIEYSCACSVRDGCEDSGDSVNIKDFDGKTLILLSDGMGSGIQAKKESRAALALLSDLLAVGFGVGEATECVNSLLAKRSRSDMYATLDVMLIDLSDGSASVKKHGSPASFVLRGDRVFVFSAEALPVGIIEDACGDSASFRLIAGDTVVMMTDGAADALGDGVQNDVFKCVSRCDSIKKAAEELLKRASANGRNDDMTIVISKVIQKIR